MRYYEHDAIDPQRLNSPSDFFEVALLLGASFLVNFVTADSKTNWAEGFVLLSFYTMMVSFCLAQSSGIYPIDTCLGALYLVLHGRI